MLSELVNYTPLPLLLNLEDTLHILYILYTQSVPHIEKLNMLLRPPFLLAKVTTMFCSVDLVEPDIERTSQEAN